LLLLALAVFQKWNDRWVWGVFLLTCVVAAPNLLRVISHKWEPNKSSPSEPWTIPQAVLFIIGVIIAFTLLLYSFLPPMSFDGLEYHLGVPWAYWQEGGMKFLPHLFYSNFPMNTEMLFTLVWRIGGEPAIQALHCGLAILTSLALFEWLKGRVGRTGALLGSLLFLSDLQIMSLAVSAKIDLLLVYFSFLCFESLWAWWEAESPARSGPRNKDATKRVPPQEAILAGLFCGFAVGCKYSAIGIVGVPLALGFLLGLLQMRPLSAHLKTIALSALCAILLFLPWAARNYRYQGNPVFPLAYSIFGGRTMDTEINQFMKVTTDATWPDELKQIARQTGISERIIGVWRILTQGEPLVTLFLILFLPSLFLTKDTRCKSTAWMLLLGWLI